MPSPTTHLPQENDLMYQLLDLLKQEQQFLIDADAAGLSSITPRKSALISQLSTLSQQRLAALAAAGFEGEAGMQAYFDAGHVPQARQAWDSLLDKTREAKELNRVNGLLITKQMANNQQILDAMRPAASGQLGVYGPDGQPAMGNRSRGYVVG
jgi:flagellar biosynthesis protein FlgN